MFATAATASAVTTACGVLTPARQPCQGRVRIARPPEVLVTRVTGAGDTFMAAHIAAELRGETGDAALETALKAAAAHVSGDIA